ncbi:MAG TPA: winged helix-turn-helix domain-containing protein [Stellaceae bacterium]|nr:winged helix-turn-helix domain-containing protein [Stellaceae bacterium]
MPEGTRRVAAIEADEAAIEFGRFRVLPRQRQLLADGAPVELGTRAFDVLMVLLEAQGALVTKQELLDRVWPETVVEENNIQVQISTLRRAFGADRNFILTVPLRGYRFTAEMRRVPQAPPADAAPSPATPAAERAALTDLPASVSAFIGRERERQEVTELIRQHRMVTLIGSGGIGKTRLAVEVARGLLPEFPDGVWLVELAPLADAALVPSAIKAALGLQAGDGTWSLERLAAALRAKRLLLILDNCEHVIAAAAREAEALLHAAPDARVLATSQEPLGVEGECLDRVQPLGLPGDDNGRGEDALRHDAVRLFVARAREADPHLELTEHLEAVSAICRRLDGIPLAIELAAARAATLGVAGLAQRLDDRFHVLTGGRRTALPRYQTLRATLDWSHNLLAETDRIVLRRLAVFAGSFTLDAAASIVADATVAPWQVVERIAELVAKSLVVADSAGAARRYRLLDTMRAYALEKLADSGEFATLALRHAAFFCDYFASGVVVWEATPSIRWLETYAPEIDNVRAALEWAFGAGGDEQRGIELAATSRLLWYLMSLNDQGRLWLERAIAVLTAATPKTVEAQLWYGYGFLCTGEPRGRALPALKRAVGLCREIGEGVALGRSLGLYGLTLALAGRIADGTTALEEASQLLVASDARKSHVRCLTNLAIARMIAGRCDEARRLLEEALALGRAARADFWVLRSLVYKAEVEFADGHVDRAIAEARQAVGLCRAMRRIGLLGHALCNLAGYLIAQGALDEARAALREGLPLGRQSELGIALVAGGLVHMAAIAAGEGRHEEAARFLGYAHAFFATEFEGRISARIENQERLLETLARALAPDRLAALTEAGARWTEEEAMAAALAG